jgi:preprotein translocase subunit SecA
MSATIITPDVDRPLQPPEVSYSGRLGPLFTNQMARSSIRKPKRMLARSATLLPLMRQYEQEYGRLSEDELPQMAARLRGEARTGKASRKLTAQAFGLCSVAVWRVLGMRPFDVQLAAGACMHDGCVAELATGEGKTLTATFPTFLNALAGKGVHVATVNDYLAKRDADDMVGPVYEKLGLSIGCLQQKMDDKDRIDAYKRDVTYGTASEFGFDFLRDMLKVRGNAGERDPFWTAWMNYSSKMDPRVQRGHYFALVDEADSIFIDEARTPLIISSPTRIAEPHEMVMYQWADSVAKGLDAKEHFRIDLRKDKVELTEAGRHRARYSSPPAGPNSKAMDKLFEAVEKSIQAHFRFVKDHHDPARRGKERR